MATPSDQKTTQLIEGEFLNDNRLSAHNIQVEISDSCVTLRGHVNSYRESLLATEIASSYPEIREVRNELEVQPGVKTSDPEIELQIRNTFVASADITSETITIKVRDGKVLLGGHVGSYWERTVAEDFAKGVTGVIEVENRLNVNLLDKVEDEELCNAIKAELSRTRGLERTQINVAVCDGTVELNGTVDHSWQKDIAQSAVRRFSIIRVINDIIVK